nr:MAG TPA: hypothetical protein [Caudoviricetes sp.]
MMINPSPKPRRVCPTRRFFSLRNPPLKQK